MKVSNHAAHPRRAAKAGLLVTSAATAAMMLLSGCTSSSPDPAPGGDMEFQKGGTLSIAIYGEPGNLDPIAANTGTSNSVYNAMCYKLYEVNMDGIVFPQLAAEDAIMNEDNTVATVKLREGVVFADGSPFDADAVKFGLDRHMHSEGSLRANELSAVDRVEIVDDYTVDIILKGPTAPSAFDVIFTNKAGVIVSKKAVEELGDEGFNKTPVCVGPFKYESRIPQDSVTLVKDDLFYDAENVHLDKVIYRVIPDSSVRTTNLRAGELQVIEAPATVDVPSLEADPALKIIRGEGLGYYLFDINVSNLNGEHGKVDYPLAQDKRIRQALELSIDRVALNKTVFNGLYGEACGFMAPTSPLASEQTLSCSKYDPERAKDLLAEVGVKLPIKATITVDQRSDFRRMAEVIQSMASEVGFEFEIEMVDNTALYDKAYPGNFETMMHSWSGRVDPAANVDRFVESHSERSHGKFKNDRVDELLALARSINDADARIAAYDEIDKILKEEVPLITIVRPSLLIGMSANVDGIQVRAGGTVDPTYAGYLVKK